MQVLLDSHLTAAALQITDLDSVEDFTAEVTRVHSLESVAEKIVTAFVQPFYIAILLSFQLPVCNARYIYIYIYIYIICVPTCNSNNEFIL